MRRGHSLATMSLAIGASLLASAAHAEDAASPDALLQEGAKITQSCIDPKPDWPQAKLSSNFDTCNDGVQTLVKAMDASKDVKTVEAATPSLTRLNVNLATTALRIGHHYADTNERKLALAFLRVACTSFDAVSSFDKLDPDQAAEMKAGAADADGLLKDYHTSCKAIVTQG